MKERPILFSGPMVRAILENRKTQTRRAMVPQPSDSFIPHVGLYHRTMVDNKTGEAYPSEHQLFGASDESEDYVCKFGQVGDWLWVKETFRLNVPAHEGQTGYPIYRADFSSPLPGLWKPSIFMPRWASRITLEIVGVRVERLQDISEADVMAEGIEQYSNGIFGHEEKHEAYPYAGGRAGDAVTAYRNLWEAINGAYSWDKNPWVWVIEFKRV